MTQPTPEEVKRLCPDFLEGNTACHKLDEDGNIFTRPGQKLGDCLTALAQARLENEKLRSQVEALQKKPEIGPPPVFEHEMNCEHKCAHCSADFERLLAHYSHQLSRELSTLKAGGISLPEENEKLQGHVLALREALGKVEEPKISEDGWCTECHAHISESVEHLMDCSSNKWLLENTDEAAKQAEARIWNEAIKECMRNCKRDVEEGLDCVTKDELELLLKPEGGE